jgi:very-short-patch-repair endonuclease
MSYRNKYKKSYEQPQVSPIEISFWETAKPLIPELQREAWIDKKYRVDFLVPSKNVIVELYGYQYHNTKYKITKDAERERYLQGKGYQVIRFTGTEVYKDTPKCVNEVLSLAHIQPAKPSLYSGEPSAIPISVRDTKYYDNEVLSPLQIQRVDISLDSSEPIAKPFNINKINASYAMKNNKTNMHHRKKILGMEKWQINVLGIMFIFTLIVISCSWAFLANLKVP